MKEDGVNQSERTRSLLQSEIDETRRRRDDTGDPIKKDKLTKKLKRYEAEFKNLGFDPSPAED